MGGSALLIYGQVTDEALGPRPVRRTILDRIIGRSRTNTPAWTSLGPNRRLITLPTDSLAEMAGAFRDHVKRRFSSPWQATSTFFEYLRGCDFKIYLRGDEEAGKDPEWYVQVTFSGNAGLSELSAVLAVHWAERWYSEHASEIAASFFTSAGFVPNGQVAGPNERPIFVPLGAAGYGIVDRADSPESASTAPMMDVDQWVLEAFENVDSTELLERAYVAMPALRSTNSCHCQWCAPGLDPTPLGRVVL